MKITGTSIQQLEKDKRASNCRKWRLWVSTELGRKSRRFNGTYSQACNALKAFKTELEGYIPNADTFAAYAASWVLWREKSGDYAPGTIANNKKDVKALCRTALVDTKIQDITPEVCRNTLIEIKANPVRGDGELSNTTMNKIYTTFKAILQQAEDDGKISRNPMAKIKPPKPDTKEKDALSPDELMLLLNRLDEQLPLDGRVMALYLMACLGLRRGEACALMDADVSNGFAYIHRAIKERDGSIAEPKTKAGIRKIPLPPRLAVKVDEWRTLRNALGFADAPTLACNTRGGVMRPQLLQRWWMGDAYHNGVRDTIGCAGMTLHQLRHSNLSMMARHMSPFDLQRYAGWSSIEPAKIYVHDDLDALSKGVADAWCVTEVCSGAPDVHHFTKKATA